MLPVSSCKKYPIGTGIDGLNKTRLKYGLSIELGANPDTLNKIDSFAHSIIKDSTIPGCQIFCAKDGIVFYNKSFGYHTYDSIKKVEIDDIYDLASVTKLAATTLSLMHLNDGFFLTRKFAFPTTYVN